LFGLHWDIIAEMTGMQLSLFTASHAPARCTQQESWSRLTPAATDFYVASGVNRIIIFREERSRGCHEPVMPSVSLTFFSECWSRLTPAATECGAIKKPRIAPGL
jgi:hypothetical protein